MTVNQVLKQHKNHTEDSEINSRRKHEIYMKTNSDKKRRISTTSYQIVTNRSGLPRKKISYDDLIAKSMAKSLKCKAREI